MRLAVGFICCAFALFVGCASNDRFGGVQRIDAHWQGGNLDSRAMQVDLRAHTLHYKSAHGTAEYKLTPADMHDLSEKVRDASAVASGTIGRGVPCGAICELRLHRALGSNRWEIRDTRSADPGAQTALIALARQLNALRERCVLASQIEHRQIQMASARWR
ncbi:MAG: hypothetical protein SF069_02265 [Phycisphaerae bacterium]|nr:hypothetical protein [Phycisphaerae bacterium]